METGNTRSRRANIGKQNNFLEIFNLVVLENLFLCLGLIALPDNYTLHE